MKRTKALLLGAPRSDNDRAVWLETQRSLASKKVHRREGVNGSGVDGLAESVVDGLIEGQEIVLHAARQGLGIEKTACLSGLNDL